MPNERNTGSHNNYYLLKIKYPKRLAPYEVECEDVIAALGMDFSQGEAFKALWRECAATNLGIKKANYDGPMYDAEKSAHYTQRNLQRYRNQVLEDKGLAQAINEIFEHPSRGPDTLFNHQPEGQTMDILEHGQGVPAPIDHNQILPGTIGPITEEQAGKQADDLAKTFNSTNNVIFIDDYQRAACRTAPAGESTLEALNHCSLGLFSEGGEYTTEVKRAKIYGRAITPEMKAHMIEELGDALWYIAYAAAALDTKLSKLCQDNVDKLRKRFPDKFSQEAAEARADKGGADARSS